MYQINVKVQPELGEAYYRFCRRQEVGHYALLNRMVEGFGRCQLLVEAMRKGNIEQEEALKGLGQILTSLQLVSRLNGQFKADVARFLEPRGLTLDKLGL